MLPLFKIFSLEKTMGSSYSRIRRKVVIGVIMGPFR